MKTASPVTCLLRNGAMRRKGSLLTSILTAELHPRHWLSPPMKGLLLPRDPQRRPCFGNAHLFSRGVNVERLLEVIRRAAQQCASASRWHAETIRLTSSVVFVLYVTWLEHAKHLQGSKHQHLLGSFGPKRLGHKSWMEFLCYIYSIKTQLCGPPQWVRL